MDRCITQYPVPFIPELDGEELDYSHGNQFEKGCHPNVVMVNAIDEQHFHSVHPMASSLADGLHFDISTYNENCQVFDNDKPVPKNSFINRFLSRFYGPLTYRMVYWNGSTGSVTVGPDMLHFHIIFALRPTADGKAAGQTDSGYQEAKWTLGWFFNRVVLLRPRLWGIILPKVIRKFFRRFVGTSRRPSKQTVRYWHS